MRQHDLTILRQTITASSKWLHMAIYLGYRLIELGADEPEIWRLIKEASKDEIDKLLLEKMKHRSK